MRLEQHGDITSFAAAADVVLRRDPVGANVPGTLIDSWVSGDREVAPGTLWLLVRDAAGVPLGLALRAPPRALLLTDLPDAAVDALATGLAGTALPGVGGPAATAGRFAGRWAAATGRAAERVFASGVFRLDAVAPPAGVSGLLRTATSADRDVLVRWSAAFSAETLPHQAAGDPAAPVDSRLRSGGMLWLWHDGGPVSTAWTHPPVAGVVRISGVYTPPEHRGRGYAGACVAALSQRLLDGGAVACTLHTDLANPTSNRIYRAIGYRPVAEHGEWRFGAG